MLFNDVQPNELINKAAKQLEEKKLVTAPEWAIFVKTGSHKVRPPIQANWWELRCAALLRTVAIMGPIGTNKLKVKYGGKKRRGHKKSKFQTASGSVIRNCLQQLTAAGLIAEGQVKAHKGRVVTKEGLAVLNGVAKEVKAEEAAKVEA